MNEKNVGGIEMNEKTALLVESLEDIRGRFLPERVFDSMEDAKKYVAKFAAQGEDSIIKTKYVVYANEKDILY